MNSLAHGVAPPGFTNNALSTSKTSESRKNNTYHFNTFYGVILLTNKVFPRSHATESFPREKVLDVFETTRVRPRFDNRNVTCRVTRDELLTNVYAIRRSHAFVFHGAEPNLNFRAGWQGMVVDEKRLVVNHKGTSVGVAFPTIKRAVNPTEDNVVFDSVH
jgi:hypothetical protein